MKKICVTLLIVVLMVSTVYVPKSNAYREQYDVDGRVFYIKNMYSGKYLDVAGAVEGNGTNVQQYEFNGSDSQKWYANHVGDGIYRFVSFIGKVDNGSTIDLYYALDVSGGDDGNNGVNIQLWELNDTDAQKFGLDRTFNNAFILRTGPSGFDSAVTVNEASCNNSANVFQWEYNGTHNDEWLLEPCERSDEWGVDYALANAYERAPAYPNLSSLGGDCANFVSQCMLAGGMHYENNWYMYRKTGEFSEPANRTQLNSSWQLSDPSPWISAEEFESYWTPRKKVTMIKGKDILNSWEWYQNSGFTPGDVVQYLDDNILNRQAEHTMYITGIAPDVDGQFSFTLTYHSLDKIDRNLLDICRQYPNKIFKFYDM